MKKISIVIICFLICFLGCNKKDERVVRIAYMPSLMASQLYIGIAKGYFEEEGIKVAISEFNNGPDIIAAIRGKSIDIGFGIIPSLIISNVNGLKVKSIGGATFENKSTQTSMLIVPIDSEIQSAQDLKGKRIAVIAEGTTNYFMLLRYLKTNGIKKEEVEIISIPHQEMIFALVSNSVDAAATTEPYITMGALDKKTRTFDFYYPDDKTIDIITAIAHEDFINADPELIAKFSRVIDRATDFINNEEKEFRKLLPILGEHGIRFKVSKEVADSFTTIGFRNAVTYAGVEAIMDVLIENNVIKEKINIENLIYSPK